MIEPAIPWDLGKDLGLFMPNPWKPDQYFWLPGGMTLVQTCQEAVRRLLGAEYVEVRAQEAHGESCGGHGAVFQNNPRSYRDLPVKLIDLGVHGHIFCSYDQIQDELSGLLGLMKKLYGTFEIPYQVLFGTKPKNYIGTEEQWTQAEINLEGALRASGTEYAIVEGAGEYFGPAVAFAFQGEERLGVVNLDLVTPFRLGLTFMGEDGVPQVPAMIHRQVLRSFDNVIFNLLDFHQGALPSWMSPVQVRVLTQADKFFSRAYEVGDRIAAYGARVDVDPRSDPLGAKVRAAESSKIPWIVCIGEKEFQDGTVAVRQRGKGDLGGKSMEEILTLIALDTVAPF